jgi:hypothetical protein
MARLRALLRRHPRAGHLRVATRVSDRIPAGLHLGKARSPRGRATSTRSRRSRRGRGRLVSRLAVG